MPAVSRSQQAYFGWLKSNPAEAAAKGISPKVVDEFAHAPGGTAQGLPQRAGNKVSTKPVQRKFGQLAP